LEKVSHLQPFLRKYVPNGGSIPGANQLREAYLPKLLEPHQETLKAMLNNIFGFSLLADESNDKRKHSPVNFLIAPASNETTQPLLVDIKFVDESPTDSDNLDSEMMLVFIKQVLTKYNLPLRLFDAFVSDGAAYNTATAEKLKLEKPRLIFIWCVCHMLDRVGVEVQKHNLLKPLKEFSKSLKKIFSKSRARRSRWHNHLGSRGVEKPRDITRFGKTRWCDWIDTCVDALEFFPHLPAFIQQEAEISKK